MIVGSDEHADILCMNKNNEKNSFQMLYDIYSLLPNNKIKIKNILSINTSNMIEVCGNKSEISWEILSNAIYELLISTVKDKPEQHINNFSDELLNAILNKISVDQAFADQFFTLKPELLIHFCTRIEKNEKKMALFNLPQQNHIINLAKVRILTNILSLNPVDNNANQLIGVMTAAEANKVFNEVLDYINDKNEEFISFVMQQLKSSIDVNAEKLDAVVNIINLVLTTKSFNDKSQPYVNSIGMQGAQHVYSVIETDKSHAVLIAYNKDFFIYANRGIDIIDKNDTKDKGMSIYENKLNGTHDLSELIMGNSSLDSEELRDVMMKLKNSLLATKLQKEQDMANCVWIAMKDAIYANIFMQIYANCAELHEKEDKLKFSNQVASIVYKIFSTYARKYAIDEYSRIQQEIKELENSENINNLIEKWKFMGIEKLNNRRDKAKIFTIDDNGWINYFKNVFYLEPSNKTLSQAQPLSKTPKFD